MISLDAALEQAFLDELVKLKQLAMAQRGLSRAMIAVRVSPAGIVIGRKLQAEYEHEQRRERQ